LTFGQRAIKKVMTKRQEFNVIKPVGMKPRPDKYEEIVAELLANHFESDVKFIKRKNTTTPDVLVVRYDQRWEIKNIRGNSKFTIQNNLRAADDQSENVVISLLRTKMTAPRAEGRIKKWLNDGPTKIKRILLVTKARKIIVTK